MAENAAYKRMMEVHAELTRSSPARKVLCTKLNLPGRITDQFGPLYWYMTE
jgi:hypothetical protein